MGRVLFSSLGHVLGIVIGTFFFLLLSFAALTSTVSLLEVPVAYIVDEHKLSRKKAVWIAATIIFIVGLPTLVGNGYSALFTQFITYVGAAGPVTFDTFLAHVADVLLVIGGCLIVTFAAYVWKKENLHEEIGEGFDGYSKSIVKKMLNFQIAYLAPVLLAIMFVLVVLSNFFGFDLI